MAADLSALSGRLQDIREEISGVRDATAGLGFETFEEVWVLRRASERALEIISEASRHIPDDWKRLEPDIPWRQIAGIGNVLRHDYEGISSRVVWDIVEIHLAPLDEAARRLLVRIEDELKRR
jgi:uncharacterized protein with HEPN domain